MAYKTIVVHLADDPEHGQRLQFALGLAQRFGAHLDVVYTSDLVELPAVTIGRAASMAYLDEVAQERTKHIKAVMAEADKVCAGLPSWEWHAIREGQIDEAVARYAHLVDLVIGEQPSREILEMRGTLRLSDLVQVAGGCPVLVSPSGYTDSLVGRRPLIAWKNHRASITALRSALPLMQEAEGVRILADAQDSYADSPGAGLVTYLKHQGIAADVVGTSKGSGEEILAAVEQYGCDLLVMGAGGRSSLRELIVGTATSYVLRHSQVPVFIRH